MSTVDVEQPVDGEIVPEETAGDVSQAVVPQSRRREVLVPLNVADQRAAMDLYQRGLREILSDDDWQQAGRGERFVKKSGWRKIAAWFDLSIELVRDHVDRDDQGNVLRATVWARAVAPSGRFADGDGHCAVTESRFADVRGRQKLENDLRGTAATRAVNRAISSLVGMGAVSAEEVDAGAPPQDSAHPHGPPYAAGNPGKVAGAACVTLAGGQPEAGAELWRELINEFGYVPHAAATALILAAKKANS